MNQATDLTIVTVAGPGDEALLLNNIEHIARNNPEGSYVVHVFDNGCFHGYPSVSIDLPLVVLHKGTPPDISKPKACRGSYQHAAALNRFIHEQEVQTRFLLILDPDFFILQKNWIKEVCKHMETCGLWFFGAPWHPKWFSKHRYFPCVHCLFIDTKYVKYRDLDFTPDLVERGAKADKRNGLVLSASQGDSQQYDVLPVVPRKWLPVFLCIARDALKAVSHAYIESNQPIPLSLKVVLRLMQLVKKLKGKFRALLGFGASMILNRKNIGCAKDTGYLVEMRFSEKKENIETLVPSVYLATDFGKNHYLNTSIGRCFEKIVPERWSYIPKARGYFTAQNFRQCGLPDVSELNWEEFFWSDIPFGFHMRRYNKVQRDIAKEDRLLHALLRL